MMMMKMFAKSTTFHLFALIHRHRPRRPRPHGLNPDPFPAFAENCTLETCWNVNMWPRLRYDSGRLYPGASSGRQYTLHVACASVPQGAAAVVAHLLMGSACQYGRKLSVRTMQRALILQRLSLFVASAATKVRSFGIPKDHLRRMKVPFTSLDSTLQR
eukprot:SAG31_NODE_2042_length_6589_cov_10.177504_4_plen_159_part_00